MSARPSLSESYGPKAAQLIELTRIEGVTVPPLFAFSDEQVLGLFAACGLDIVSIWSDIADAAESNEEILASTSSDAPLGKLRENILAVSKTPEFHAALTKQTYDSERLEAYLGKSKGLMIRSSGSEDSAECANAGGHESYPSDTSIEEVAEQFGKVLASYFKFHGLSQRASSGEDIRVRPKCSLFAQTLIAEATPAGSMLRDDLEGMVISGVAYTQGQSRLEVNGVLINAAFGHGQGVVESEVPSDRIFVHDVTDGSSAGGGGRSGRSSARSAIVEYSVQKKTHRIAGKALERIPNPPELHFLRTLTEAQSLELATICRQIERENADLEMDIEWVLKDGEFFVVQSRPKPALKPSDTLTFVTNAGKTETLEECQILVPGYAVTELAPGNTLCAPACRTLDQARKAFLTLPVESKTELSQNDIQAVLVSEPAAEASHEAGFFRARGIPCLKVKSLAQAEKHLCRSSLTLDPQFPRLLQGVWFDVRTGLSRDPSAHSISFFPIQTESLICELEAANATLGQSNPACNLRESFQALRAAPSKELIATVLKKMGRLCLYIGTTEAKVLWQNAIQLGMRLKETITDRAEAETSIEQLTIIRQLEALTSQANDPSVLNSVSIGQLLKENKLKKPGPEIEIIEENAYLALMSVSQMIVRIEKRTAFQAITIALTKQSADEHLRALHSLLEKAQQHGLLDDLLNHGLESLTTSSPTDEQVRALSLECARFSDLFDDPLLSEAQKQCEYWRSQIEKWANPSEFDDLLSLLDDRFMLTALSLVDALYRTDLTHFHRQLYLNQLKNMIEVFDLSVKSISSRSHQKGDIDALSITIAQFFAILERYQTLSDTLLERDISTAPELYGSIRDWDKLIAFKIYQDRLKELRATHREKNRERCRNFNYIRRSLSPSKGIATDTLMYTGVDYQHVFENITQITPEDDFTRMHQHMLFVTSRLNLDLLLTRDRNASKSPAFVEQNLPKQLAETSNALLAFSLHCDNKKPLSPVLHNIAYAYPSISVRMNLALRSHCATIDLRFDRKKNQITSMGFNFIMAGEVGRVRAYITRCKVFALENGLQFFCPPLNEKFDDFGWYANTKVSFKIPDGVSVLPEAILYFLAGAIIETTYQQMGVPDQILTHLPEDFDPEDFFEHGLDGALEVRALLMQSMTDTTEKRLALYEAFCERYRKAIESKDIYNIKFLSETPDNNLTSNHEFFRLMVADCLKLMAINETHAAHIREMIQKLFQQEGLKSTQADAILNLLSDDILPMKQRIEL